LFLCFLNLVITLILKTDYSLKGKSKLKLVFMFEKVVKEIAFHLIVCFLCVFQIEVIFNNKFNNSVFIP